MAKILIIDDDPDVRTLMKHLLQKEGHEVETVSREKDVFNSIESFSPAIILLDVLLSGADGRKICRSIKNGDKTGNIPVIMFSAHPGAAEKIGEYGADDFIAKPVSREVLISKLSKFLAETPF
jgi:DNA-binding response OmpR family regulator